MLIKATGKLRKNCNLMIDELLTLSKRLLNQFFQRFLKDKADKTSTGK